MAVFVRIGHGYCVLVVAQAVSVFCTWYRDRAIEQHYWVVKIDCACSSLVGLVHHSLLENRMCRCRMVSSTIAQFSGDHELQND